MKLPGFQSGDTAGHHSPLAQWADKAPWRWSALGVIGVVALIGCYGLVGAMDTLEDLQAMEDEREEALRYEQVLIDQAQYLQKQCGGPEATVVEKARGGWDCYDTNGRKTKTIPGLARPALKPVTYSLPAFSVRDSSEATECANSIEPAGMVLAGFLKG